MESIRERFIQSLGVDLTYRCNFQCLHCYNHSGENNRIAEELDDETFLKLVDDLIRIQPLSSCLCGGEPLLRKELALKMCRRMKKAGLENVNIVSNGYIMTPDLAQELKEAGFDLVQISLDGATAESHDWLRNKPGSFVRALNAIECLKKVGLTVGVAFTPTKRNINEFEKCAYMLDDMGVALLRCQPVMGMGRATSMREYFLNDDEYYKLARKAAKLQKSSDLKNLQVEWGDPLEHITAMQELKTKIYALHINAYGDIQASPYIPMACGNLKKHSLLEYTERGIINILKMKSFNKVCQHMTSFGEMQLADSLDVFPEVGRGDVIVIDLIDDNVENKDAQLYSALV